MNVHPLPASPLGRALRLTARACLLRCPACGGQEVFEGWFTMRRSCPSCGLRLERGEEGYVVGAYMFNIIAAELLFAVLFLAVVVWRWPSPPWEVLEYGGLVLMVLAPLLFYPFSRSLFLAFDLIFRPEADGDRDHPPAGHA